ncbi:MAG: hypothetical protein ABW034_21735 [Steroidobacteraceae bacterium]
MYSKLLALCSLLLMVSANASANDAEKVAKANVKCRMNFTLEGWSVIYKTAKGAGVIKCSNGQSANVTLSTKGGGLTVGKSRIDDGIGEFSSVTGIDELFGAYAAAEAHAGAVKSAQGQVMTKGQVSLAWRGIGRGWDLGIALGRLTIKR